MDRTLSAVQRPYYIVPFHYAGVVREFPTAPRDSFFIANASYVAQATGSPAYQDMLIWANGSPPAVAREVRHLLGPASGAAVQDINSSASARRLSFLAFTVDAENAGPVLQLCRRLDGIPLALELAAVRLGPLSLDQLNSGLASELSVLGNGKLGSRPAACPPGRGALRHQRRRQQALLDTAPAPRAGSLHQKPRPG